MGVYDQFIWFGDSLIQQAWGGQEGGFGAGAAMQNCECDGKFLFYTGNLDVVRFFVRGGELFGIFMLETLLYINIGKREELLGVFGCIGVWAFFVFGFLMIQIYIST